MDLIEVQKNDEALWFTNPTAFEWMAQRDLRALHSTIRLRNSGYKNVVDRVPENIRAKTAGEAYIIQAIKRLKEVGASKGARE